MFPMRPETFEDLVTEAWEEVPERFRRRLENIAIVVEEFADPPTLRLAGLRHPSQLLGFYHGVPLPNRGQEYGLVAPDKISIYRIPILQQCETYEEVRQLAGRVLRHEIAHYFGIDDDRLLAIGAY